MIHTFYKTRLRLFAHSPVSTMNKGPFSSMDQIHKVKVLIYMVFSSCYFFYVFGPSPLGCASSETALLIHMRFNRAFGLNFNYVPGPWPSSHYVRNPSTLSYRHWFLISRQVCPHSPPFSFISLGYRCNFSVVFCLGYLSTFPSQPLHLLFLAYRRISGKTEEGLSCGTGIG